MGRSSLIVFFVLITSNLLPVDSVLGYSSASQNQKLFFILLNFFSSTYLQVLCFGLSIIVLPYALFPVTLAFSAFTANSFCISPCRLVLDTQSANSSYIFAFIAGTNPYILVIINPWSRYHFIRFDFNNIFVAFIVPINFLLVVCFLTSICLITQSIYSPPTSEEYVSLINNGGMIEKYSYKCSGTCMSTSTQPQKDSLKKKFCINTL